MKRVLEQYVNHMARLYLRAVTQKRELTHGEQKAVAWYNAAAERVQALINAPTPAWTFLKFEKSRIL